MENHTSLSEELSRNVLLVSVQIHRWRGRYKTKNCKVEVADKQVKEGKLTTPQWNLLPETWSDKFSNVETKIRSLLKTVALDFPIRGISVVPRLKAMDLFASIDELVAQEFVPLVKAFCQDWQEVVQQNQRDLSPEQFAQTVKYMGDTPEEMQAKFGVAKYVIPFGAAGGFEALSGNDAAAFTKEINEQTQAFLRNTASSIVESLQDELNDAVDNLTQRLTEGGIVKEGTLDQVRRAFDKLNNFQFVASPEVLEKLKTAKASLEEHDAKAINKDNRKGSGGVTAGLTAALKSLREQFAKDGRQSALFSGGRRSVVV